MTVVRSIALPCQAVSTRHHQIQDHHVSESSVTYLPTTR